MGKSRGSQRTKGNVRPSSSGHSAELLGSTSKLGFVGFSGCKVGQHVAQNTDANIDGMFAMVMKKMLKRDATTKLKAIQEFRDLCVEKEKEAVLEILAFWPRLYNKLALDFDRRIREATQEANAKLVEKVKRDIAPYLRNIMGVWLLSQNDLNPPIASSAQLTFNLTFPQEKQSEALMFCKDEILSFFKDNLFEQTAQSLSEPNVSSEEVEYKYALVICGTLCGLKQFVSSISSDSRKTLVEEIKTIVSSGKFWKFAKNKDSQIRVAWYNLVSALCHDMPEVFQNFESKLGCAVLGCLSECDAIVAPAIWEAALYYVAGFEDCWDNLDVKKVVLPELWTLLKEGGRGNAHLLFPCLLPFLSKLPMDVIKQQHNFFPYFFLSIIDSLFLDSVKASSSECNAIITAYIECMNYVCFQLGQEEEWDDVVKELVYEQLVWLVERSFSAEGAHLPVSKFYPLLGTFMQTLENNISKGDSCVQDRLKNLLQMFCDSIFSICERILSSEHLPQDADLVFLAYFFHCMYEPTSFLAKQKRTKVRFDNETYGEANFVPKASLMQSPIPLPSQRIQLFSCTVRVSKLLHGKLGFKLEPHNMKLFTEILSSGRCPKLFQELLKNSDSPPNPESESPLMFFEQVLIPWLNETGERESLLENIVNLIYVICSCVEKDTALKILNNSSKVENPEFLRRLLQRGVAAYGEDKLFCKWLRNPESAQVILGLFNLTVHVNFDDEKQKINAANLQSFFSTLNDCLFHSATGELVIDRKYSEEILSIINATVEAMYEQVGPLQSTDVQVLEFMCESSENILTNCSECWRLPIASNLLKMFLELNLCHQQPFTQNLKQRLCQLWKLGVEKLAILQYRFEPHRQFVLQVAFCFHKLLTRPMDDDTSARIFESVSLMMCAIRNTYESVEEEEGVVIRKLSFVFGKIFPTEHQWVQMRRKLKLSLLSAYLEKKLFFPLPEEIILPFEYKSAPSHSATVQNVSHLILNCINCPELSDMKPVMVKVIVKQLFHLLWAYSYNIHQALPPEEVSEPSDDDDDESKLQKKCFEILSFLPKDEAVCFLYELSEMSVTDSSQWIFTFKSAVEMVNMKHSLDTSILYDLYLQLSDSESSGKQLMCQLLVPHLPTLLKSDILLLFIPQFCKSLHQLPVNLSTLAKICCCIQDNNLLSDPEVQDGIVYLITETLSFIRTERLLKSEYVFLMSSQIYSVLSQVMKICPHILTALWELILDFACVSLYRCDQTKEIVCTETSELIHAYHCTTMVSNLLSVATRSNEFTEQIISQHRPNYMSSITKNLLNLFLDIAGLCNKMKAFPEPIANFLATIAVSIEFLPSQLVLNSVLSKSSLLSEDEIVETTLRDRLLPFLTLNVFPTQLGAHSILTKIMPLFPSLMSYNNEKPDDAETKFKKLQPLVKLLEETTHIVESMLSDIKMGACCYVLPDTDSYIYTSAFLFAWGELLEFFTASTTQERSSYATYLGEKDLLSSYLSCLFRLLPENPTTLCANIKSSKSKDGLKEVFLEPPSYSALDIPSAAYLQHVACNTYFNTLKRMPAAVRSWGHSLDKRAFEAVNKFTAKYVSSILAAKEVQSVHENSHQLAQMTAANMTVQACPGSREVVASYTVDSSTIELIIQLPPDFPFGPLNIEKRGNVKLNQSKLRKWLMQLTAFLTYQNGSILDGLMLWKKNLDKTFEGVEECLICYFILHSSSLELPQKSCPTCKKKFHAMCIHKWFVTSNNTACPLCRNFWY